MKADACNSFEVERHGFIHALLKAIVDRLDTAYWNVKQEQFENRKDWEFLEIPGFEYRRYSWEDCDCGADAPVHAKDCRLLVEHSEWNRRRIDAISDPSHADGMTEEERQAETERLGILAIGMYSPRVHFDRSDAWEKENPRPLCSCGAAESWKRCETHLDTCSPTKPNMKFGPVVINWYKYLGRGTSTNVDWNEAEWRKWFDAAISAIKAWEAPALRH